MFFMLLPAILLGGSVVGWAYMIHRAVDDPSFAVERDYYKKASEYDTRKAQLEATRRLGFHAQIIEFTSQGDGTSTLLLELSDRRGEPVDGLTLRGEAFANARASSIVPVEFTNEGKGQYRASVKALQLGLWELRLNARLRSSDLEHLEQEKRNLSIDDYVEVLRTELTTTVTKGGA